MSQLFVNGEVYITQVTSLSCLLDERGLTGRNYAVAVNHQFIPKANYHTVDLKDGDHIELVMPMQGG